MLRHPLNVEPPLTTLMRGPITPASLHYVRSHGPVPRVAWNTHRLSVGGLVERPATFSMDQLLELFEEVTVTCTLTCAGNRRKEENMVAKTIGFNWCARSETAHACRADGLASAVSRTAYVEGPEKGVRQN